MASPPWSWISAIVGAHGAERLDLRLDPQRQQVSAERRHLLADHDLERQAAIARHRPPGERGIDPLVVRDRDDIELRVPLDVVEDLDDPGRPIRREGVDMQVRPPEPLGHRAASRSGQSGWNTASHCSGAAAMWRSKARASASRYAVTRSRREPSAGKGTGSTLTW